ncbi:protein-glutamate O-methyltransferase CheR [Methyloversatilis sp.]|uniref:CheR family methyltransferase n=1 Tax=Methyloversatilis sp. TaxID=2569862 RepID=UPI002735FBC9|nr:CheR family methyltransferase [Methyloversatilis sp.]MDP3289795.1 CheR family methyltransferase [Methyloversatilis sp.]MDP3454515.1 CheR family methyltransferase [Methyloversatilis sp.]MDP3578574.1 CheR family methyltransferase [Methyloversatilis sp.]
MNTSASAAIESSPEFSEAAFGAPPISDVDFRRFQRWLHEVAGIALADHKKTLLMGRLSKRLGPCGVRGWRDYFELLMDGSRPGELQVAIDLLTTNETYFFREPAHFSFLRDHILNCFDGSGPLRIWSAASSSGEEIYTLAMVLADAIGMGRRWEIFGSDLSTRVLETARRAHYPMTRADKIPPDFLKRFCLKGTGPQAGTFLIDRALRERVSFAQINLNETLPDIGVFDIVFVRNVMIYFDPDTKRQVMARILTKLKPRGYVFVSHSENLHGITDRVDIVKPSMYRLK